LKLKAMPPDQELFILWLLKTEGEIGRYRLAEMLGVPQGVARGILTQMSRDGLIHVRHRAGTSASSKGLHRLLTLKKRHDLREIKRNEEKLLGLDLRSVIFQIAGRSRQLGQGIEQRDAAIKAGATGAVTFLFDGKTLKFPGVAESLGTRDHAAFEQLKNQLVMKKGDVILIAFASTWWNAARGGFAAVTTLA
jgi:DNA-binding MarR family transcriptional regulator